MRADEEADHVSLVRRCPAKSRSPRGSSASRTLSPSRLNASVVISSASAGEEHEPPGDLVVAERLGEHVRPRSPSGGTTPEAEERERRLEHDRGGDQQRQVDDHRREQVREDVDEHDPQVARAERARRLDVLALADRQRLAAHDAADRGPAEERDDDDRDRAGSARTSETSAIAKSRNGNERITSMTRARTRVDRRRRSSRRPCRRPRRSRTASSVATTPTSSEIRRAVGDAHEHVAAEVVGAEQERAARPARQAVRGQADVGNWSLGPCPVRCRDAAARAARPARSARSRPARRSRRGRGAAAPRRAATGCGPRSPRLRLGGAATRDRDRVERRWLQRRPHPPRRSNERSARSRRSRACRGRAARRRPTGKWHAVRCAAGSPARHERRLVGAAALARLRAARVEAAARRRLDRRRHVAASGRSAPAPASASGIRRRARAESSALVYGWRGVLEADPRSPRPRRSCRGT